MVIGSVFGFLLQWDCMVVGEVVSLGSLLRESFLDWLLGQLLRRPSWSFSVLAGWMLGRSILAVTVGGLVPGGGALVGYWVGLLGWLCRHDDWVFLFDRPLVVRLIFVQCLVGSL